MQINNADEPPADVPAVPAPTAPAPAADSQAVRSLELALAEISPYRDIATGLHVLATRS